MSTNAGRSAQEIIDQAEQLADYFEDGFMPATPAPDLTGEQQRRVDAIEAAPAAEESLRVRVIDAMTNELDSLGLTPGWYYADTLADAALAVVRGES